MEKQRFAKPYLGRYWLYRKIIGGVWRKYGYTLASNYLWGWYWTMENYDYTCGGQLEKLKEKNYGRN